MRVGAHNHNNNIINNKYHWENVLAEDETSSFCGSLDYSLNSCPHVDHIVNPHAIILDKRDRCTREEILHVSYQPHKEAGDCFKLPLGWLAKSLESWFG